MVSASSHNLDSSQTKTNIMDASPAAAVPTIECVELLDDTDDEEDEDSKLAFEGYC